MDDVSTWDIHSAATGRPATIGEVAEAVRAIDRDALNAFDHLALLEAAAAVTESSGAPVSARVVAAAYQILRTSPELLPALRLVRIG